MDHPPYSPDFALSDFHPFGHLKQHLDRKYLQMTPVSRELSPGCKYLTPVSLQWDISLGTLVGQMLKCQWWLHGSLMCTMLHLCHVYIGVRINFWASHCMLPYFINCFAFSCRMSCPVGSLKISSVCMHYKNMDCIFYMWATWQYCEYCRLYNTEWRCDWWITSGKGFGRKQLWADRGIVLTFAWKQKYSCGCHVDEVYSSCLMSYSILCMLPGAKVSTFLRIDQLVPAASFTERNRQGVLSVLILVSWVFVLVLIPCH